MHGNILLGLLVNGTLAAAAFLLQTVTRSGAVAGAILGTLIWWSLDWRGWAILVAFFAIGSALTRFRYWAKDQMGLAEPEGGRRDARRALAKVAVPALFALAYGATGARWLSVAFVCACATGLSDTAGTEIGQLFGKYPVLLPSFRPVHVGTRGAVSIEGTVAGAAASFLLGVLAWLVRVPPDSWKHWVLVVVLAALVGTTTESIVVAKREEKRKIDDGLANLLTTVVGGLAGGILAALLL